MTAADATRILLVLTTILLILWDVAVYFLSGQDATISVVLRQAVHDYPVIALLAGIALGHIIWHL